MQSLRRLGDGLMQSAGLAEPGCAELGLWEGSGPGGRVGSWLLIRAGKELESEGLKKQAQAFTLKLSPPISLQGAGRFVQNCNLGRTSWSRPTHPTLLIASPFSDPTKPRFPLCPPSTPQYPRLLHFRADPHVGSSTWNAPPSPRTHVLAPLGQNFLPPSNSSSHRTPATPSAPSQIPQSCTLPPPPLPQG